MSPYKIVERDFEAERHAAAEARLRVAHGTTPEPLRYCAHCGDSVYYTQANLCPKGCSCWVCNRCKEENTPCDPAAFARLCAEAAADIEARDKKGAQ